MFSILLIDKAICMPMAYNFSSNTADQLVKSMDSEHTDIEDHSTFTVYAYGIKILLNSTLPVYLDYLYKQCDL